MSNRRSLIGEVGLPKTSEKMWNRINVELFDTGKTYSANVSLDYTVSENTILSVYLSDDAYIYIQDLAGTNHLFNDTNIGSSQGVTVTSWNPLEDDNFKYIVFPMHLNISGNSMNIMSHLFNFLQSKYVDDTSHLYVPLQLEEALYINNEEIGYIHVPSHSMIYLINKSETTVYVMTLVNNDFAIEPY